jgi:hypothetical protein
MDRESMDYENGETPMSDMQTKLLMAAIADIFVTSKSLDEAYERFKRITNAAGILLEEKGRN